MRSTSGVSFPEPQKFTNGMIIRKLCSETTMRGSQTAPSHAFQKARSAPDDVLFPTLENATTSEELFPTFVPRKVTSSFTSAPMTMSEHTTRDEHLCPYEKKENDTGGMGMGGKAPTSGKKLRTVNIFAPAFPSAGTALHSYGACIPCDYLASEDGCTMGKYCGFCHLCSVPSEEMRYMIERSGCVGPRGDRRDSAIAFEAELREVRRAMDGLLAEGKRKEKEGHGHKPTNIGSHSHFTKGACCSPCLWIHRAEGCKDGEECTYCHLCDASVHRLKKTTRQVVARRVKSMWRNRRNEV